MDTYAIISQHEDLEGIAREDLDTTIDVSADEADWAIESEGWCGTTFYRNDDRAIVISQSDYAEWASNGMPLDAMNYLHGKRFA